jgi:competence protein ComEC
MSTVTLEPIVNPRPDTSEDRPIFARPAPLLPVAAAVTLGIAADRWFPGGLVFLLAFLLAGFLSWLLRPRIVSEHARLLMLWTLAAVLGGAWHHVRHLPLENDIAGWVKDEPSLIRLRGIVLDLRVQHVDDDPLRSRPAHDRTTLTVRVGSVSEQNDWVLAEGTCRVVLRKSPVPVSIGDEIEALGVLAPPAEVLNPGQYDIAQRLRDQEIGAVVHVKSPEGIEVRGRPMVLWPGMWLQIQLAKIRHAAGQFLHEQLPRSESGLARALLLGENEQFWGPEFEAFQRTGVYHVLAISGQHLAIVCLLLWPLLQILPGPRWVRAVVLGCLVVLYTGLTGAQPPILRAAIMVLAVCGGIVLRRRVQPINTLALAWLLIAVANPSDLFQTGCQISFLCVLALFTIVDPLVRRLWRADDPLVQLIRQSQPPWERFLRRVGRSLVDVLLASAVLWLVIAPLISSRYHLVSPMAILLTPPMLLLSTVALTAGFAALLLSPFGNLVTWPFLTLLQLSLDWSRRLVEMCQQMPFAYWHTPGLPEWWLLIFYVGFVTWLLVPRLLQQWKLGIGVGLAWLCVGLALPAQSDHRGELRCTVLAVGHGSCAVLQMPDGRVLLYDAGSMMGPEVTTRQIAPFLWSEGISRIDEVLLSHADLDHFNGLPALLDRFRVGQVTMTPTFLAKQEPGVTRLQEVLERWRIPLRTVHRGQQLRTGDVTLDVLHPAEEFLAGTENARSLVLLVRYRDGSILLTGDLEEPGLSQVMQTPAPPIDVLLAPHHGSPASNTEPFARWAKARLVISSEGNERRRQVDPYGNHGGELWRTPQVGAVTIRVRASTIEAVSHVRNKQWKGDPVP